MKESQTALASALAEVVGGDFLTDNAALKINSLTPAFIAAPGSHDETRECLKVCAEFNAAVVPAGVMTWLDGGNPLRRADVVLSLRRMNRVIEYSPSDLTATVEVGLPLQAFNEIIGRERQWLPLDPPGAADSTLGAIVSCASFGALRFGFGTPRDYVIGLRLAHIDGTESKCGGRVVKNVAGYDMDKLYTGSFGTLAVLTELTFKLRPLPERAATLLIHSEGQTSLANTALQFFKSPALQPASILLTNHLPSIGDEALLIRFVESDVAVRHQLDEATKLLDKNLKVEILDTAKTQWDEVANVDKLTAIALRISVPVATIAEVRGRVSQQCGDCMMAVDFGTGIIRLAFDADTPQAITLIERLRAELAGVKGTLFIECAPAEVKSQAGAWEDAGNLTELMRGIKRNFDPEGLLNPGRFVAGI